ANHGRAVAQGIVAEAEAGPEIIEVAFVDALDTAASDLSQAGVREIENGEPVVLLRGDAVVFVADAEVQDEAWGDLVIVLEEGIVSAHTDGRRDQSLCYGSTVRLAGKNRGNGGEVDPTAGRVVEIVVIEAPDLAAELERVRAANPRHGVVPLEHSVAAPLRKAVDAGEVGAPGYA